MKFNSEKELLDYTKNIKGKTFNELDTLGLLSNSKNDKGILGKIVETGFYKYPLNSNPEADFANLGIELKVTGYKLNKRVKDKTKIKSAKERVSLSMIDFCKVVNEEFEFSKLIFKNKKILFIWYEYTKENKDNWGNFIITDYQLYDMSIDIDVFKNDFNIIKQKIINGQAHKLSEGDTSYLGACRKGNGNNLRIQPVEGSPKAKSRAFSLKNSYMTGILRSLGTNLIPAKSMTVEDYIYDKLKPYIGMTQIEIWKAITGSEYHKKKIPNNISKMISDRIIGKDLELPLKDDIFSKTSYVIKNTSLNEDTLYPNERLAFRNITISEFSEEWDNSDWKNYFEEVSILLICYECPKNTPNGFRKLKSVKKISFTSDDLDSFKESYNCVKNAIDNHNTSFLPRPGTFENQILEIAPKGNAGDDAYNTFFNNDTTRTCFMFEKEFLFNKLNDKL